MSTTQKFLIVIGVIAFVLICGGCTVATSVQSTQASLLSSQQAVERGKAQYGGALDIVTQKIVAAFSLADRQIAHEDRAYQVLAKARETYNQAVANSTPPEQVEAALNFNVAYRALVEDNPEFASAEVVQAAMNASEEAVNEIFTAFQDWQDAVQSYNTYRGQLFMPLIVGNLLGYPRSYQYYEAAHSTLDLSGVATPPASPN